MGYVSWSKARQWIILTGVSLENRSTQYSEELFEFAESLRDGVILCAILNLMKPGCVQYNHEIINVEQNEFLCKRNVAVFLETCRETFRIEATDLFETADLYHLSRFELVLHTLALLSQRGEARDLRWTPIEIASLSTSVEGYENMAYLTELAAAKASVPVHEEEEEENIYDEAEKNCSNMIYDSLITYDTEQAPDIQDHKKTPTAEVSGKQEFIRQELLDTEGRYVKYIRTLIESYIPSLKQHMTSTEKNTVFMNIEEIFQLHLNFYRELSPSKVFNNPKSSGPSVLNLNAFIRYEKEFLFYAYYCTYLDQSSKCVDQLMKKKPFRNMVETLNKQLNRKFPMKAQLAVCFQRVLKYPLLLKELKKNTSEDHEEFSLINAALASMEDVAVYINEYKRDIKNASKTKEIRKTLVFDATVYGPSASASKDLGRHMQDGELQVRFQGNERKEKRFAFLFEHALLFCKSKGDTNEVRELLEMNEFIVGDCPGELGKGSFSMRARVPNGVTELKDCTIVTKSEQLRDIWVTAVQKCIQTMTPSSLGSNIDNHNFTLTTFQAPEKCSVCQKFLLGLISQGYVCQKDGCKLVVHFKCLSNCPPCVSATVSRISKTTSLYSKSKKTIVDNNRGRSRTMFEVSASQSNEASLGVENHQGKPLDTYPWFAGILSRHQCASMLQGLPDGSFLIRQSEKGGLVLSIQYNGTNFHIKLKEKDQNVFLTPATTFSTVEQLIFYYRYNSLGKSFPEVPILLKHLIRSSEIL